VHVERLCAVTAAGVEGATWTQFAEFAGQLRIGWAMGDLVAVLAQGLLPETLPVLAIVRYG
jgi:hypothetical protein